MSEKIDFSKTFSAFFGSSNCPHCQQAVDWSVDQGTSVNGRDWHAKCWQEAQNETKNAPATSPRPSEWEARGSEQ